jgi:hypothetical protein
VVNNVLVVVAVRSIALAKSLEAEGNGTFMTYYPQGTTPAVLAVLASLTPPAPTAQSKPKPQKQDREPIDVPAAGDWTVSDDAGKNPLYFKGSLKPEQARYAYTLQTGTDYVHVRSKRV